MFRDALFLARRDLLYMFRARETWLWTFLMPVVFFYFIGTVTAGFSGKGDAKDPIIVSKPGTAGFLADRLTQGLKAAGYRLVEKGSRVQLRIPEDFTASVIAGKPVKVVLTQTGEGLTADQDRIRIARVVYTLLADSVVLATEGSALTAEAYAAADKRPRSLTMDVRSAGKRVIAPSGFEQAVPGTLVMFTLLVLFTSGGITLVVERRQGILRRLASSPMSRGAVVLGKWAARWVLGLIQVSFAMAAGTVFFHVSWGPNVALVAGMLAIYAGLVASLGILLGNYAKNEGQCAGLGVMASNVMAALGGCWWPVEITPDWTRKIALLFPTGWAMDALHKLVNFGDPAISVLPHTVTMIAAALAAGWFAARSFRFQ